MNTDEIKVIEQALDNLLTNRPIGTLDLPSEYDEVVKKLGQIEKANYEMQKYAVALSKGELSVTPPPRENYMAAGLKQLHAQLRHITWQAQNAAAGDYGQQIDFMGTFGDSFNTMVGQLHNYREYIEVQMQIARNLLEHLDPVFIVKDDMSGSVLYANIAARRSFGVEAKEVAQSNIARKIISLLPEGKEQKVFDVDSGKWYDVSVYVVPWNTGKKIRFFYCSDVTDMDKETPTKEQAAERDEVTGLYNRYSFETALFELWEMSSQFKRPISLIAFDLDDFKKINAQYGQEEADKCIKAFSDVLRANLNSANDIIARYSNEEFMVLLPFTNAGNAVKAAETIRLSTEAMKINIEGPKGKVNIMLTVSGGVVSLVPKQDNSITQFLHDAREALYLAKQNGKNQICRKGMRLL